MDSDSNERNKSEANLPLALTQLRPMGQKTRRQPDSEVKLCLKTCI